VLNAPNPQFLFGKDKFDSHGIFFGVGGGYPALGGQFSASAAIAYMSGKWSDQGTPAYNNHADNTFGFSLGGGYTYKFSQAWGVTGDIRLQRYNYDFATSSVTTAYQVSEKIASAGVKLSYQF
jgi:outer membrane scaffolding protein for murein synthesis (MipA/OmpV family)